MSVAKPEAFVPVHGEYRHMVHHAELAVAMGIRPDQVLLCEDGDAVRLDHDGLRRDGTVPAGYVYVDGTVGDIGHGVLRDRKMLAEEGVVMVVATVDLHTRDPEHHAPRSPLGAGCTPPRPRPCSAKPARWWPTR